MYDFSVRLDANSHNKFKTESHLGTKMFVFRTDQISGSLASDLSAPKCR